MERDETLQTQNHTEHIIKKTTKVITLCIRYVNETREKFGPKITLTSFGTVNQRLSRGIRQLLAVYTPAGGIIRFSFFH